MKHEIHNSRLKIDRQNAKHFIGQGGFGYVMQGLLTQENGSIPIAAKIIRGSDLQTIFRECLLMRQLMVKAKTVKGGEFPPIVRYFGSMYSNTDDAYELILVMELCDTDLHRQIEMGFLTPSNVAEAVLFPGAARRTTPRAIFLSSSSYALDIAIQAAKGLCFLHENGIVHRDIKPSNLLMSFRENQVFVKLTDVGVSKEYNIITTCGQNIGTLLYHSPEIRLNPLTNHSPACDVYSFGLVLWEVWYGRHVFSEIPYSQLEKHISLNTPDFMDYYPPAELKDLIEACWNKNPTVRPFMKQIVQALTKLAA